MVNIADVARHAGVSRSTVSYALSGKRQISARTRERVLHSVRELGFEPNPAALALTTRQTGMVALAATIRLDAPAADVAALDEFVMATAFCLRSFEYDMVLLAQPKEGQIQRLQRGLLADGLIVMDVLWEDSRLPVLAKQPGPVVLMGAPRDRHGMAVADFDYEAGAQMAVEHLVALGHRSIALVSGPDGLNSVERFERATANAARTAATRLAAFRGVDAFDWLQANLRSSDPCTALIVHDQQELAALLERLHQSGTEVPRDLSVLAVATQATARSARQVSLIRVPVEEIVQAAVLSVIEGRAGAGASVRLIKPVIEDRGTTRSLR